MIKKVNNLELEKQRQMELAGVKPMKKQSNSLSDIMLSEATENGVSYVIVKEGLHYYIKTSNAEVINESTLDYIGGLKNKGSNKYRYHNFADAQKNLNLMLVTINERLEKDIQYEEPPVAPGEGDGPSPAPEVMPDAVPAEPSPAPAPEVAPSPAPSPEPAPAAPSANDDGGVNMDDDSDLDDESEGESIDHYVGKLTAALREKGADQISEDKIKSVLNSVISALPLHIMAPEERLIIARRIKKGKGDDAPSEAPAPAADAPEGDLEEGKLNELSPELLKRASRGDNLDSPRSKRIFNHIFKDLIGKTLMGGTIENFREWGTESFAVFTSGKDFAYRSTSNVGEYVYEMPSGRPLTGSGDAHPSGCLPIDRADANMFWKIVKAFNPNTALKPTSFTVKNVHVAEGEVDEASYLKVSDEIKNSKSPQAPEGYVAPEPDFEFNADGLNIKGDSAHKSCPNCASVKGNEVDEETAIMPECDDELLDNFLGQIMDDANKGLAVTTPTGFKFKDFNFVADENGDSAKIVVSNEVKGVNQEFNISSRFYNEVYKGFIQTLHSDDSVMDEGILDMFSKKEQKGEDDELMTNFFSKIQRGEVSKSPDGTYKYKNTFIKIEQASNMVKLYMQKTFPDMVIQIFKISKDVLNNVVMPVLNGKELAA